jgi:hypothetical protein
MLKKCNITPYVLLDGGYEMRKMKTTKERLRSRIAVIKHIIPLESYMALPLMMREVFVSATKSCNVKVYRCFFEADNEIGNIYLTDMLLILLTCVFCSNFSEEVELSRP